LIDAWRALGADIQAVEKPSALPLRIRGKSLDGGALTMPGDVSSQFISGVIMGAPLLRTALDLRIQGAIVQHAYVLMTLDMMHAFGVEVEHDDALSRMRIAPQGYTGQSLDVEADASTAGYFFALAALNQGTVRVTNLGSGTRQPDLQLCDVLERMGCGVIRDRAFIEVQGPPKLRGNLDISMQAMSDQTLTVAALAPFADGPITLRDVAHIRHHESDRIGAMCTLLQQLKVPVTERPDGMTITPAQPVGSVCSTYDDHRIAMSLAVLSTRTPGVVLKDPGCVSKTCPTFFEALSALGIGVDLR
jgi:3-phosphoshikimate 1-carboxyvinyltransferase